MEVEVNRMHRPILVFCLLFLACASLPAGGAGGDLKKMDGAWLGAVVEIGGKPPTEAEKNVKFKLVIQAGKYTIFFGDMKITEGIFKLDESKKPKTLDATPADGEFKGKIQPAIYHLDGDELKVVFTEPGKDRPTEFKTRDKTQEVLIVYKRQKAGK